MTEVRWMIRRDMPSVLAIEGEAFEHPWTEDDFMQTLRQRNTIGLVCECAGDVVGYAIYETHKNKLVLLSVAVKDSEIRKGFGTALVKKLIDKLGIHRRHIYLEIRETNVKAQLFFKSLGFRATKVLRNAYEDTNEDVYVMRYRFQDVIDCIAPDVLRASHEES